MNNEVQKNNNVIERALLFSTMAHMGQVRKNQPDKPYIIHPIGVAEILIQYGADNNVIAAGLLHDVVEESKYTLKDIKREFGEDVAHLVEVASEPERKQSDEERNKNWEDRKQQKIDKTRKLNLREKLVLTADKIDNIENLLRDFKEKHNKDFSAFRIGKEKQEWYNRAMYYSLINEEDKENPLFKRLENGINTVFERTMEE